MKRRSCGAPQTFPSSCITYGSSFKGTALKASQVVDDERSSHEKKALLSDGPSLPQLREVIAATTLIHVEALKY